MKMIKQVKIFRDLVGESEFEKEERLNDFLKDIYDNLDIIENFVTQDGEVVVIIHYFINENQKVEAKKQ